MGVSKLFVFCAIILVAICEETNKNQHPKPAIVDNRSKTEKETDAIIRDRNSKLSQAIIKPKIIRLAPVSKPINPFKIIPNNFTPIRSIVPVAHKSQLKPIAPTIVPETQIKQHVDKTDQNSVSMISDNTKIDDIKKPNYNTSSVDLSAINKISKNDSENKNEEPEEKLAEIATQIPVTVNKKDMKTEATKPFDAEKDKSIPKETKNSISKDEDKDVTEYVTGETKNLSINEAENNLPTELISKSITTSEKLSEKTAAPNIEGKKARETDNSTKFETPAEQVNNAVDHTKPKEAGAQLSLKINPLSIVVDAAKIMVPKILQAPLTVKSKTTSTNQLNNSVDTILLKNIENEKDFENDLEDILKTVKVEPNEELIIQNNDYEELFESSAPLYSSPKVVTSELHPAQSRNFSPIPSANENFSPINYDDENTSNHYNPYSYEIKKYRDKYVINAYDESTNENSKINSETLHPKPFNQRNDNYYQPQVMYGPNFKSNCYEPYRNKVWRCWRNNQVIIRPKYTSLNIEGMYAKGYLKNVSDLPVYGRGSTFSSPSERNHNISPYSNQNPTRLRDRNGY